MVQRKWIDGGEGTETVKWSGAWGYVFAGICVAIAAAARLALDPLIGPGQFLFAFVIAVVVAVHLGGRGPGLFASLLSVLVAWYVFVEPRFSFSVAGPQPAWSLVALTAGGAGISLLLTRRAPEANPQIEISSDAPFYKRTVLFASALLVLTVFTYLLFRDFDREKERQGWVSRSYQVLDAIHVLMSDLQDAETGQRGYLLTGDESYRAPFEFAARQEQSARRTLRWLTADNPVQQSNMDALDELAQAKFGELEKTIAIRRSEGAASALAVVRTGEGIRIMDELRAVLARMQREDQRLLAQRIQAAQEEDARMRWVMGLGSGSLLLLLVIAGTVIERDSRNRERARQSMNLAEERLRLALDAAAAGIIEWTPATGESIWSDEVWSVYGVPPHSFEPSYEMWRRLVHPDDRSRAEAAIQETVRSGTELDVQYRVIGAEGKERWVLTRARPLRDHQGGTLRVIGIVLDITARVKAEEALRESDAQFRTLANAIPQLCWMAKADGSIFWYNQRWYDYTGATPEQMEGWGWQSVHDPAALPEVLDRWKTSIATGEPLDMTFPLRGADGTLRPFLTRVMPVRDREGKVTGWFGTSTDIARQHLTEKALREREELLKTFVQHVPAAVAMLDSEMRYLQVSDRWYSDYALPKNGLIGRSHYEIFPDIPERWKEIHCRCLSGETLRGAEDCWERASGDTMWLHWEIRPWGDRAGKPEGLLLFTEDISERKRVEATVREGEATIRTLLETAAQAILAVNGQGAIVLANRMAGEMFGYGRETLLGMSLESLIPERLRARHQTHRIAFENQSRTRPMGIALDLQGLRQDGTEFPIEVILSSVETGRGSLSVAFVSDITLRKQAEASLRKSENELGVLARSLLTAQEDERRRVARDLHDDVTQRLALLSIDIGKLAAEIPASVEEIRARLQTYQRNTLQVADEVRRVSHGLHPSAIQDVGLSSALEEFCEEFSKAQNISLTFAGPSDDFALSAETAACLYRVAQESLQNAAKHSRATEIRVELAAYDGNVHLMVSDNGVGFPIEANGAKQGLGLVSMKERIRAARGTISITSQPGLGTEIFASVPLEGA